MKKYDWQIVGHDKISKFLQKGLSNDKLAHAYLFSGKAHLGKRLMAAQFIDSIMCADFNERNNSEVANLPCGKCIICQQLAKKIHPDVYFLTKEDDKKNISVEDIREMQRLLHMASFLNSYKIALIENADDLSESAQNALLKILEEPKKKTILILLTSDYNLLLPTIVSRCQLIKFQPVERERIFQYLVGLGSSREQANILAPLAHGQIGTAIDLFRQPELFQNYISKTEEFLHFFPATINQRFKIVDQLLAGYKSNIELIEYLQVEFDLWQIILRDILAIQYGANHLIVNLHFQEQLAFLARAHASPQIIKLLDSIKLIKKYFIFNVNPRLAVENLVLNF